MFMRHLPFVFAALALTGCNQTAPDQVTAMPSAPATIATTNATIEPVPGAAAAPAKPSAPSPRETAMTDASPPAQTDCGAGKAAKFVGKAATPQVRMDVAKAVGHLSIRWIGAGDVVTMDYSEGRLNADLDDGGKIKGFRCG